MFKIFRGRDTAAESSPQSSYSPSSSSSLSLSPPVTGPARPIRLVYYDEKGKFRMDSEAVAALQLVKEPIGVVSVCGRSRQGKSFILNQLLGRSSGFQVASTHRPCTKGLWLWSAPLKRTALDGTEYNLLLLDSEGIDAFDQTGTYSTQIFSLAVLLSSMFIYNQMGGIDEAALDRLSLVTQMTKHIRVRASGGRSSASELGQFSPIFVWLLRDFYLDLVEDNKRITPRDYLELALRPVQGSGKDIAAKNEIRDSIRALFPDRECFPLVRPLNNENDLQRLDQISLDKLRPEFRAGLDALTKFVFERTRPKQVGATVMTGPILVGITESYLEALNNGAVPTISSSWQSVEEAECRRAYDTATEIYMSSFDRSKPPEEVFLRESHDEAVQKSLAAFNAAAVGIGSVRKTYEGLLQKFFRRALEDYKRNAFMEADLRCSNAIQNMEKRLRAACHASDANVDNIVKVLDGLLSEYETSCHGPGKWQKLAMFLQQSLEGPILDLAKRLDDKIGSEKSSLMLRCRSMEDKMTLLHKQLEASEKDKSEYMKRYDEAINEKKKLADDYMRRINDIQSNRSSLDERCSSLVKALESANQETSTDRARADAVSAQKEKSEFQKLAIERVAQIERAQRHVESLDRQKNNLASELERVRVSELEAVSKVSLLEARVEEREKEIESLLKSNNEERASTVKALQDLLEDERKAHSVANKRAEDFSHQLEVARAKLDALQQEFTSVRLNESALDNKLKAASHGKRFRTDNVEMGVGSVQDAGTNDRRVNKRSRSTTSPVMLTHPEDGGSVFKGDDDDNQSQQTSQQTGQEDYKKFTVQKLRQELTKHNFGAELLKLRSSNKKEVLALYEKCFLRKS
ncbi:GUANYLATE BINDING PROTEIN [Salix viminalis]|uniref:GUANYLATE BINDING PROTEIN n=1 Tax=Salix viminalis TaxID=40686 RepID=A0A9Q0QI56_SALVM|nr:GUANYLATE BINDING PROTEIN [Salix viminalis]